MTRKLTDEQVQVIRTFPSLEDSIVVPIFLNVSLDQVRYYYHTNQQHLDYWTYKVSARFHRRSPLVIKVPLEPVEGRPLGTVWEVQLEKITQVELHSLRRILKLKKYEGVVNNVLQQKI